MTPNTKFLVIFFLVVFGTVFGMLAYLGGPLAMFTLFPFLLFGIVGSALIAKRNGRTWRDFLDD